MRCRRFSTRREARRSFTDVKEIGKLAPEIAKKSKPLQSGFSVGHVRSTAGTLGAIVKRDGKLYLLSNCHVLARSGNATAGDQIVYPGPADGGRFPPTWWPDSATSARSTRPARW